jgi:site-specific DNA-methyltransferase (adenine-specific)
MKNKKYQIIYADPPWSYYNDSTVEPNCTTIRGMRRPPYPVMSSREIMNLPIKDISAENCILFIWTTDYHLEKCLEVIKNWGFEYKTIGFIWAKKDKKGKPVCFMGAYTMKSGIELCLLATKGKDAHKLVKKHNVRSLVVSERKRHSEKPLEVKQRIIDLLGDLPRIELFARQKTEGWDVWGNEVKSDIDLNQLKNEK